MPDVTQSGKSSGHPWGDDDYNPMGLLRVLRDGVVARSGRFARLERGELRRGSDSPADL